MVFALLPRASASACCWGIGGWSGGRGSRGLLLELLDAGLQGAGEPAASGDELTGQLAARRDDLAGEQGQHLAASGHLGELLGGGRVEQLALEQAALDGREVRAGLLAPLADDLGGR